MLKLFSSVTLALAILLVHNTNCATLDVVDDTAPETPAPPTAPEPTHLHYAVEERILRKIKENPFISKIRPNETTHVKVNMYVRHVEMKHGKKLTEDLLHPWNLELTFRQYWNDPRLVYSDPTGLDLEKHPYFPLNCAGSIWKPDLFFPETSHADFHEVTTPNSFVWVYPNGDVVYSVRVSLDMRCSQSHSDDKPRVFGIGLPSSTHVHCPFRVASYGYTTDQLTVEWVDENPIEVPESLLKKEVDGDHCKLEKVAANGTMSSKTRTGTYESPLADFEFLC